MVLPDARSPMASCCFGFLARDPRITTGYWDFRGLGAPMRMMCVYAGSKHEDVKYGAKKKPKGGWIAPEWERKQKPVLREQNPLAQLPYVINHDTNEVVTQSNAVYLYLGRLFQLNGKSREEQLANEQILFYLHTMWMEMRDLVYPSFSSSDEAAFKASLDDHFVSTLPSHYEKLEGWLRLWGTRFFAGPRPCVADFHVWEMFDQEELLASAHDFDSPLGSFQMLQRFYREFRDLPRLKPYFESGDAKLPVNNKMAFFK